MAENLDAQPIADGARTPRERLFHAVLIVALALGLYANTYNHQFALDDSLFITGNKFTQSGFDGLADIWTTDAFIGAYGETINLPGGRYRPLAISTFAIEYELFGPKPTDSEAEARIKRKRLMRVMHSVNILLYGLTGLLLYLTLLKLFPQRNSWLPLVATLLFVAHPLHTEVVANIKSRDEMLALFFLLAALNLFLSNKLLQLIAGSVCFLLALLSKESSITALAFVPLAVWLFGTRDKQQAIGTAAAMVVVSAGYVLLRSLFTEDFSGTGPKLVADSPYLLATTAEKWATIVLVMGKNLWMQLWPHPLSFDYTYNAIPYTTFADWRVLLSLAAYLGIGGFVAFRLFGALRGTAQLGPVAFGALWFLAAYSIVSNVVFNIGAPMGERFLYIPSVGACIALAALLERVLRLPTKEAVRPQLKWLAPVAMLVVLGSSATMLRNPAWENNYELYKRDVETVPTSARARMFYGIILLNKHQKNPDAEKLALAVNELKAATEIDSTFYHAFYNLGIAYQGQNEHLKALESFKQVLQLEPKHINSHYYLGLAYGKGLNNLDSAIHYIELGLKYGYNGADGYVNLGTSYAMKGEIEKALSAFEKALPANPRNAQLHLNISLTYRQLGDLEKALAFEQKAFELDPALKARMQ